MRTQIDDIEAQMAAGGVVVITSYGRVGFSTTEEIFDLQNVDWKTARDLRDDLLEQNPRMGNREFDQLCKNEFLARGWI